MIQQFVIGERVKAIGFTDCFGKDVPETNGLVVTEIRLFKSEPTSIHPIKPYFRVLAVPVDGGYGYHEGAEQYFATEQANG